MALRPGRCVRRVKRPWTRVSKKKPKESYVAGVPYSRIRIFEMGNKDKEFEANLWLISKNHVQMRDNALEAARVSANKFLQRSIGSENYFFKILIYPHQILREHAIATGAGADRYSMGMRKAFGRPKGRAAIVNEGQKVMWLRLNEKNLKVGKDALKRASNKLPTPCKIETSLKSMA